MHMRTPLRPVCPMPFRPARPSWISCSNMSRTPALLRLRLLLQLLQRRKRPAPALTGRPCRPLTPACRAQSSGPSGTQSGTCHWLQAGRLPSASDVRYGQEEAGHWAQWHGPRFAGPHCVSRAPLMPLRCSHRRRALSCGDLAGIPVPPPSSPQQPDDDGPSPTGTSGLSSPTASPNRAPHHDAAGSSTLARACSGCRMAQQQAAALQQQLEAMTLLYSKVRHR